MNATIAIVGILVVGVVVWLVHQLRRGKIERAPRERGRLLQELQEIERKRQGLIDDTAQRGVTISTDRALKPVEELKEAYRSSGREEAAREVERLIREFREQNGPEIPIAKAYALMQEIEGKHGQ
jgi:hypothetical protein